MSNITCILDACSVINLIHIDEDEFLLKKFKHLNIHICEKVFKEVGGNVFSKFEKLKGNKEEKEDEIKARKKRIDTTLYFFRGFQITNEKIEKDLGKTFFETIKENCSYQKYNGEFYSTALAIYLTTLMPTKLFFHTDDYPARDFFSKYYTIQQIGQIEDTADLLVLLYRLDENFSLKQLDKALSDLFSEYALDVSLLEKRLREIESSLPLQLLRIKEFRQALSQLINKLYKHDFSGINAIRDYFNRNKARNRLVCDLLELYENVFYLESNSSNFLKKIVELRKYIHKVYCFL